MIQMSSALARFVTLNNIIAPPLLKEGFISVLLVDEHSEVVKAIIVMLQDQSDIILHHCSDPAKAIQISIEVRPSVILQDLESPGVEGLMLIRMFRTNPDTRDVPLIVLSSTEVPELKAEAFQAGANDFIVKLPYKVELLARIRYHSAAYTRLIERNLAYKQLEESQKKLHAELFDAATYIKALLPEPINGEISTSWRFIPSTQLGGDAFGYHWIDSEHFAFYLIDVCGHGVRAALLSISVLNVLRFGTLTDANLLEPSRVLMSLNKNFQMEFHNNMFFTIWYGVYNKITRELTYASAGHPPAILVKAEPNGVPRIVELRISGLVIGAMPVAQFRSATYKIEKNDKLYLFSDGIYELTMSDGSMLQLDDFVAQFSKPLERGKERLDSLLDFAKSINRSSRFPDDVSILEIIFN